MQDNNTNLIGRRPVLKGAGVALAGLGGLSGSVAAKKGGGNHLADTAAQFALYWSGVDAESNDPDKPDDFNFPLAAQPPSPINPANEVSGADGNWFLVGVDAGGGAGLFDGSNIRISPNHKTLHHDFRVFGGLVMAEDQKAKPYTLVNIGDGVFESRGQTVNYTARTVNDARSNLVDALSESPLITEDQAEGLAVFLTSTPPLSILADGGRWRAVASERLAVDLDSPHYDSKWATTRVDFYSQGKESEFKLSLLFTLWDQANQPFAGNAIRHGYDLIDQGRMNRGGQ